ncbi:hypothetical protein E6P09_08445 [Haloferax mediterranei ATCC 33500]|uniref:Uncharacterized protein n=1 Tax=Haloferax mediterranei (strain ATCC 33500 / DSM 1411 / JCM 8866 / NBRC 14739 / NCIMB 2177 / R-4) TaxID=523841 RepID=I3R3I9_HALMT|nr:hypothetical protein [Haloferax mediterranei]AFK18799.1 hypothetical protein HFX_1083 [Haloferax mediterranei ATCC 33500]AHZ21833.1 hypothetical protein BM92_03795 [Haloferax mediterranei ATCC 33500]EMA03342.1 hypothetical protein C439_05070 [Haloferax mediterranei ATCC 33500]MDX5988894.1 hypothetical protein [Haloferax mediterranei ATCC 33500]QCQ75291.1 hypothetical protein E6P09_08445 [Haloferax mediterranei ATCC 33500]
MIETTIRDPEKHETLRADSQGRVNLGVQYAGRVVEIVVAESTEEQSDAVGLQQVIGDRPMEEHERQGMLFVRLFGIDRSFLTEDADVTTDDDGVRSDTVGLSDVDWTEGYLIDHKNVARFEFDQDAEEQFPFKEEITAEPVDITLEEDEYDEPVYSYENANGGTSAVSEALVTNVKRIFGYDPSEELSNVRVHPEEAPRPVMFRDPTGERYIAIAPRVPE